MNKNVIISILIVIWLFVTLVMTISVIGLLITFFFKDNEENFLWFIIFDKLIAKIE